MTEFQLPGDPRREIIASFYRTILKREPDEEGLTNYTKEDLSLETVFMLLLASDEAKAIREYKELRSIREEETLPLTLAVFCKDNEDSIEMCINSVKSIVREIVVLDTGSSDNTIEICESLDARVYKCGFTNFGDIRTLCGALARERWVLGLDSDEKILEEDISKFRAAIKEAEEKDIEIIGFPRKRWLDLGMTEQLEVEVFPDWQYRLFRNKYEIKYVRRVHEKIIGSDKRMEMLDGPVIHHFQDSFKSGGRLLERNARYERLYQLDIDEGVEQDGPAVAEIDE